MVEEKFGSDYQSLAHAFIYGGRNYYGTNYGNRMFAERGKLYSYGRHFLIAQILYDKFDSNGNQLILVNSNTASNTTSKQQWILRQAIPYNWTKIEVPLNESNDKRKVITSMLFQIESYLERIPRARTKKQDYLDEIAFLQHNALAYIGLFKKKDIKLSKIERELLEKEITLESLGLDLESFEKNQKNLDSAKKRKATQYRKKAIVQEEGHLEEWKAFERSRIHLRYLPVHLRINTEEACIQTTGGISVSLKECQALYKRIKNKEDVKGFKLDTHYTVLSYDKEFLTVGCYKIPTIEVLKYGKIIE